jgi:alpha-1,6-mannosyltransferase
VPVQDGLVRDGLVREVLVRDGRVRSVLVRGAAGSALMAVGGSCYVRLPRRTWLDGVPLLWNVRGSSHRLWLGLGLSAVGLVLLTWAWWSLRGEVHGQAAGLSRVRRITAVWAAPMLLAPPLFSGDGWSYVATGALTGRGLSPYLWTPAALPVPLRSGVSPKWRFTPSPYGPLPLAWGGAWSHLTHDPWLLLTAHRLLAVGALAVLAWAVPTLAARSGRDPVDAALLAVASPFVLAHGVGGLHNDLVMAAVVLVALVVTRPGVWLPGALLVGVAAAVKAPGFLGAVGVVLLSLQAGAGPLARVRRAAFVATVCAGVVVAAGWLAGVGTGWIAALSVPDAEFTPLSLPAVGGRWVRLLLVRAGPGGLALVHTVHPELLAKRTGVVLVVLVAAWVLLRWPSGNPRTALGGAATVLTAAVLLSPVVHYWYFFWCAPLLGGLTLPRPARAALVAGIVTLGLTALGDRALGVRWLSETSTWAVLLVPLAAALVARLRATKKVPA